MRISRLEREKNRLRIIEEAVEIFKKRGIRRTSLREIARSIDMAEPTIYKYFPSKEEILYSYYENKLMPLSHPLPE